MHSRDRTRIGHTLSDGACRRDSEMSRVLGRVELDRHPGIDEAERARELEERLVIEVLREERLDVTRFGFEDSRVRNEAPLREQRGLEPRLRDVAAVRAL